MAKSRTNRFGTAVRALVAGVIAALAVLVLPGGALAQFGPKTDYPVGDQPRGVTAADFNADGDPDLAVANGGTPDTVATIFGGAGGTFVAPSVFPAATNPRDTAAGDFDNDGRLDLVVANNPGSSISRFLGQAGGGFGPRADFNGPAGSSLGTAIVVGRFNADANLDVAVGYAEATSGIALFFGNGSGGFTAPTKILTDDAAPSLATADFDGDVDLDLAAPSANNSAPDEVAVLLNNGDGTFGATTRFTVGEIPSGINVADFNGDNDPDLAVVSGNRSNFPGIASVLLGGAGGTFGAKTDFQTASITNDVTSADFNGDGRRDLAVATDAGAGVSVLYGDGAGTFGARADFPAFGNDLTSADFNADGRQDLALASTGTDAVSILLTAPAGSGPGPVTPPVIPPVDPDKVKPAVSRLLLSSSSFFAASSGPSISATVGTKVSYRLSEGATVRFTVQRALAGRKAGKRCVKPKRSNRKKKKCARFKTLKGSFSDAGQAGANSVTFRGRLRGRRLAAGRYRLRAVASDSARNKSRAKTVNFRILKPATRRRGKSRTRPGQCRPAASPRCRSVRDRGR